MTQKVTKEKKFKNSKKFQKMEGFLTELDESDRVLMRRYAMLESNVLILSGKVGESAERLCDVREARKESRDVFSIRTEENKKRCFRTTTSVEQWIECIETMFADCREKESKDVKVIVLSTPTKTKKTISREPSTPDLRKTLQQSLQDMKSAVIDAATTTTIPRYSIINTECNIRDSPKKLAIADSEPEQRANIRRNDDLISLLLKKEEQIKRLQEMGRRQRRQYRSSRQKERKEILSEILRLKTLHEKHVQDLLQANEDLTMELKSKESELDVCRSKIELSESRIEHLESRVVEMEKNTTLKTKRKKKKKKDRNHTDDKNSKTKNLSNKPRRRARVKML